MFKEFVETKRGFCEKLFKEFVETKGEFSVGYTQAPKFAHHYFHLNFYEILILDCMLQ